MQPASFRLQTLMGWVIIAALGITLIIQAQIASYREGVLMAERDELNSALCDELTIMLLKGAHDHQKARVEALKNTVRLMAHKVRPGEEPSREEIDEALHKLAKAGEECDRIARRIDEAQRRIEKGAIRSGVHR